MKSWLVTLAVIGGALLLLAAGGFQSEMQCLNGHCAMVFVRDGGAR